MKSFFTLIALFFLLNTSCAQSETASVYKNRFNCYLNFKSTLTPFVGIDENGIKIFKNSVEKKNDNPELVIYKEEINAFVHLVKNSSIDSVEILLNKKGKNRWSNDEIEKFTKNKNTTIEPSLNKPLNGKRIVIDPGHIAGNMEMARIEQKFLHFTKKNYPSLPADSIDIIEGVLTYNTSFILKKMLEEQGAEVFLSREENSTSIGISYKEWLHARKKLVLDSLKLQGILNEKKHSTLMKDKENDFFWNFFRDYELVCRAKKINTFCPDITVIIHYNVDEKNTDWLRPSSNNFTMTFIAGGMTPDVFKNTKGKINFLRLLLSQDIQLSEHLAALTVSEFNKQLEIPIAKAGDAIYLKDNCIASPMPGVFCRNLALCRMVNSPLVYGECLYQDNLHEYLLLMKNDKNYFGLSSNERVYAVANSYFQAILQYYRTGILEKK